MADFASILKEVDTTPTPSAFDVVRRKYIKKLQEKTNRNVIIYYSGWLQKPGAPNTVVDDLDKNGMMAVFPDLDRNIGLDLVLHTPGGSVAATESLVEYLHAIFGTDIRAFVPQLAMSAGTMIACACKEIWMGLQSSLGPTDPQFIYGGRMIAAHGVLEEFKRAHEETKKDPSKIPVWQAIIGGYSPALIGECEKAIVWTDELLRTWLAAGMFKEEGEQATSTIENIITELTHHPTTKTHDRHLSITTCGTAGLKIRAIEDDPSIQDAVRSVHHACMLTFDRTAAVKILENHNGKTYLRQLTVQVVKPPP